MLQIQPDSWHVPLKVHGDMQSMIRPLPGARNYTWRVTGIAEIAMMRDYYYFHVAQDRPSSREP